MHLDHFALWTTDIERLKTFYATYFDATAGDKYINPTRGFESYFLSFAGGARLEIMTQPSVAGERPSQGAPAPGYAHLAIAVGSVEQVDALTERLRAAGHVVAGEPRWTGDGYYESVVLDPDGNVIELTV